MKRRFDLVVFDMAGTTVQDRGEAPGALKAAFREFGIEVTPERIVQVRGASKRTAIRSLLDADKAHLAEAIHQRFMTRLAADYKEHAAPVEGVDAAFHYLRRNGMGAALNTGFDRDLATLLIASLGWSSASFAALVCGDDVDNGRPAPDMILTAMRMAGVTDPERVVNVGDTRLDLEAGAAAGVGLNVGVWTGAHSREMLAGAPHHHLVESVRDLPNLLAQCG